VRAQEKGAEGGAEGGYEWSFAGCVFDDCPSAIAMLVLLLFSLEV